MPTFGSKPLSAITPAEMREWHAGSAGRPAHHAAHAYSLLRTILTSAVNDELIAANPCTHRRRGPEQAGHKIRPASVAELGALTDAMPERLRLMVALASGARCGSARWSNYAAATSI